MFEQTVQILAWIVVGSVALVLPASAILWRLSLRGHFFVFAKTGYIYAVMSGERLVRFIVNIPGVGQLGNVRDPQIYPWLQSYIDSLPEDIRQYTLVPGHEEKSWIENLFIEWFGMYWVGVPIFRRLARMSLSWNKLAKSGDETNFSVKSRTKEDMDGIIYSYPHVFQVQDAEMLDGQKINAIIVATFAILNPYFIMIKHPTTWLGVVESNTTGKVANFIGKHKYRQFIKMPEQGDRSTFVHYMLHGLILGKKGKRRYDRSQGLNGELPKLVGGYIESIVINNVQLKETAVSAELEEAMQKTQLAEETGNARIMAAKKAREASKIEGEAARVRLEEEARALKDPNVRQLRNIQAVENMKATTTVVSPDLKNVAAVITGSQASNTGAVIGGVVAPTTTPQKDPDVTTTPTKPKKKRR